jgi:hypothetical protein
MRFPLLAGGLALSLAASFFVFSCLNPVELENGETAAHTEDGRPLISVSIRAATGGGGANGIPALADLRPGPGGDRLL